MKIARFYPFNTKPRADSCWSLSAGADGRIYTASCCEGIAGGIAKVLRYNDQTDDLDMVYDLAEATGEAADSGRATQCKIHYGFAPANDGMLYGATHLSAPGYGQKAYSPWADWRDEDRSFPHSMLVAYDTKSDEVKWADTFIPREGCRCLALSEPFGLLYAVGYPRDHFWVYDIAKRKIRDLGRIGSVNAQAIFTDSIGRGYTSNDKGQLLRYDPRSDVLEEIPIFLPHAPRLSGWHTVLYDVAASPEGDCVYGVPWSSDPHMFRYYPEDGEFGRIEDLGPVNQRRDPTIAMHFFIDHCGGLVFGHDGLLYYVHVVWPEGSEGGGKGERGRPEGRIVRMNPKTLERVDYATLDFDKTKWEHYISRGAVDQHGNLYFGHVNHPGPTGMYRLEMEPIKDATPPPLRTWG